jgi:hypothetical protein
LVSRWRAAFLSCEKKATPAPQKNTLTSASQVRQDAKLCRPIARRAVAFPGDLP